MTSSEPLAMDATAARLPRTAALENVAGGERGPAGAELMDRAITAVVEVEHAIRRLTALRTLILNTARRQVPVAEAALLDPASPAARSPLTEQRAELAHRAFVADLATALQLPETTTSRLVDEAEVLVEELPRTLDAMAEGTLSYRHAQVIADHTAGLDTPARAAVEAAVLPFAATSTPTGLGRRARRARELAHPEALAERHHRAAADRCVRLDPAPDGMAWLSAFLPAVQGHAILDRLDHVARTLAGHHEPRTPDQLRTDTFAALLLDTPDTDPTGGADGVAAGTDDALAHHARGLTPRVAVTVPVLTLLGGDEPATLEGYGPISPDVARKLAAAAPSFTRILTHPETGAVLSVGRTSYAVPADLRRHLAVRDGTCRFPGCGRPAARCDADHVTAFVDGGATDAANLLHLCRRHHRLKHETSWQVRVDDRTHDAVWTSPTGREHVVPPAVVVGSDPPDGSARDVSARGVAGGDPPGGSPPAARNHDDTGPPPF